MPPKKLPVPSVVKGEIIASKGPQNGAPAKKDSSVPVETESLSKLSKRPLPPPLSAANVKLPVQPPIKRPLPVSPAARAGAATNATPGSPSSVLPLKEEGSPISSSPGPVAAAATPVDLKVKMPPPTPPPAKKGPPPIPGKKLGAIPSPDAAGAPALKEKSMPAPPAKKGPPIPEKKIGAISSPDAAGAPALKEKSMPTPPAKKGPPVPEKKIGGVPSPDTAGAPALKEKSMPGLPAKKGPPISEKKIEAMPSPGAAGAPALKEKSTPALPAKKGPPSIPEKKLQAMPSPGAAGAPVIKEKPAPVIPAKESPPSVPAPKPAPKPAAPFVSAVAASEPVLGAAPVRMKTGIVGVGPPPGVHPKMVHAAKAAAAGGASTAPVPPPQKIVGVPPPMPATAVSPGSSMPAQSSSSQPDAGLLEFVNKAGEFIGYAHGPPSPLRLQDPSLRETIGGLWLADRSPLQDPPPQAYHSRPPGRRVSAGSVADARRMRGFPHLPPYGLPPGWWEYLPGYFFPMPAWLPYPLANAVEGHAAATQRRRQFLDRGTTADRSSSEREGRVRRTSLSSQIRHQQQQRREQATETPAQPAEGEYPRMMPCCYYPSPSHPFLAYPYYSMAPFDMGGLEGQQKAGRGSLPYYNVYSSAGSPSPTPFRRTEEKDLQRRRFSESSSAEVPSYSSSDRDDDPLKMNIKYSERRRRRSDISEDVGSAMARGADLTYRPAPSPRSQRRGSQETYDAFDQPEYQTDWSPETAARMRLQRPTDSSTYGHTPWTSLERKLNQIRGGYGLSRAARPPEATDSERRERTERRGGAFASGSQEDSASAVRQTRRSRRRRSSSSRRPSCQWPYAGVDAEEQQQEDDDLLTGDQYYKFFNTHYRRSKKPWVEEVVPRRRPARQVEWEDSSTAPSACRRTRRGWDRWGFEAGLTAPRRRTYQSLNELAAHFSHIEGEDQDELISLLLLCRRLERQIEEQHLVVDMLEHELATANATLKFPPEWRALDGVDLVSLVPADSAFQPSAAAPLFLKSTVLLPKQLPDGTSPFSNVPATPAAGTAVGKPALAAPTAPAAAAAKVSAAPSLKVPSSPAAAGTPAVTGKPQPPSAAGPAMTPATAAPAGVAGKPKPPPSVGVKKAAKPPGVASKPVFKTSIKAK